MGVARRFGSSGRNRNLGTSRRPIPLPLVVTGGTTDRGASIFLSNNTSKRLLPSEPVPISNPRGGQEPRRNVARCCTLRYSTRKRPLKLSTNALCDQNVELPRYAPARQRCVGDWREAFPREVVDDAEYSEAAAVARSVRREVEVPAVVRPLRQRGKPFFSVDPVDILMVHVPAFPCRSRFRRR